MQVIANNINIEVEDHGNPNDPAIVMIMGYSAQLIYWPLDLVEALVSRGFRVIRFDNRDVGLSHKFDGMTAPGAIKQLLMKRIFPAKKMASYDLSDMAKDAVGVMDALNIEKAHIVGASMGGMIGQLVAADHAERVLTFTPIMSSTNAPGLPGADSEVRKVLLKTARAKARTIEDAAVLSLAFSSIIASEEGRSRIAEREALIRTGLERCFYPMGTARQMSAIIESGNLRSATQRITAPTLVIHGANDPLIPAACGRDIAANVKNARFELVDGMAHDLPLSKLPMMAGMIADHCQSAMAGSA